jgi:hypothetical protein
MREAAVNVSEQTDKTTRPNTRSGGEMCWDVLCPRYLFVGTSENAF